MIKKAKGSFIKDLKLRREGEQEKGLEYILINVL
jgi:hypothetical protein